MARIPPQSIAVIDDFLDPPIPRTEQERIAGLRKAGDKYNWIVKGKLPTLPHTYRFYQRVVDVLGLDEDQIVGIEYWVNIFAPGDAIHMHSDIDETEYRKTRRIVCGIAGAMMFGQCDDLEGGSFVFEDGVVIRPRENRAVLFFGGTRHGVETVTKGTRIAKLMSFWDRVPTAHQ
jgi:hypothetical protein